MHVVLVRHGPSSHLPVSRSLRHAEVLHWRERYDAVGILPDSEPPQALVQVARDATHVIASDMARAIASAERLAPGREIRVSPLLRETHLRIPRWPTRLPMTAWELLMHGAWNLRILLGSDATPAHLAQAAQAAEWLAGITADGASAVVVTHGVFRRLLGRELVTLGWSPVARIGGYANWSSWTFARP